jgi:uncharacterized protein (TIGR02453 family)
MRIRQAHRAADADATEFPPSSVRAPILGSVTFTGFGEHAIDFYDGLAADNSKAYWDDNVDVYKRDVRAPMEALLAALEPEFAEGFGSGKVFRPYRDVRFAKDKTPYKTSQGAYVAVAPATGWYVEISARGVRTGGGCWEMSGERLGTFRDAVADDKTGAQLSRITNKLTKAGWEINGEQLKTAPRGYDAEHKRIDLLRHKSLYAGKSYGFEKVIHTAGLLDEVRADWRALRPLIEWLARTSRD